MKHEISTLISLIVAFTRKPPTSNSLLQKKNKTTGVEDLS